MKKLYTKISVQAGIHSILDISSQIKNSTKYIHSATKAVSIILILLILAISAQAATITSKVTGGLWTKGATWVGGIVPKSTDDVIINGPVIFGGSTSCASLTVNSTGSLSINARTLTADSDINNAGIITLTSSPYSKISQSGTGDFTNSGTITFAGSGELDLSGSLINTGTLTLSSTKVVFKGTNAASSTVSGFTTDNSVSFSRTTGSVTLTGNVHAGAFSLTGTGELNLGTGLTHTFTGLVTISAGTLNANSSELNLTFLGAAWANDGGTFNAGTGKVNLAGAGDQSLGGGKTSIFNNLTFSGSGIKTISKAPTVNGILSMEGTATVSGASPTFGAASTIQYKGTGSQTIGVEFPATFAGSGGIIIDQGSGNTVTLNGTKTTLAGDLNIKSGTFDLGTYTVNRSSAGGTLTLAGGTSMKIGDANTLPSNYLTHSFSCSSTVEYNGTSQTVANLNSSQTYGNLILSGSGTKTLQTGTTTICNNFTISGTASTTAVVGLAIGGNVNIQTGSTFVAGAFTHLVGGNWTNSGTFSAGTSTVSFDNTTTKNINGTSSTTFNNLTLNGAGGITLGIGSTVSGILTLTNGILTLDAYNISAGAISGGSATSYVKTNSTGLLTRTVASGTATIYPVGNSAYNPITITNTTVSNTDNYNVRVIDGTIDNANSTKTVNRKWQITEDVAGGSALTVVATYNSGEAGSGFDAGTAPKFGYFNGTYWLAPIAATVSGSGPYTFISTSGAFVSDNLTNPTSYLCLGSDDAYNATKLVITSFTPTSPLTGQNNVSITVQSQNSKGIPTNVTSDISFSLAETSGTTALSGTTIGTILINSHENTLSGLKFTGVTSTGTVTASTPGNVLTSGTYGPFSVIIGDIIYKPNATTANWNGTIWLLSTNGGLTWSGSPIAKTDFDSSDAIYIPAGYTLTANVAASFYNLLIEPTGILNINNSGTLTLNHSIDGTDFGFHVNGTLQNSGTFTNSNSVYPIIIEGGTYIHAKNGGVIPVATWSSLGSTLSTCDVTGITNTALTSGLDQNFQNFIWNNASQVVAQNLSADLLINGALTLTNGIITTGTHYVTITSTGSVSSSNNARVNGNLRRYVPDTSAPTINFPIGDDNYYTPVSVTFVGTTAGSGYLEASTTVIKPPVLSGLSQTKYINRSWTITNGGVSGFTSYSPTFTFVDNDKVGAPEPTALAIRELIGTVWSTTTTGTQGTNFTQCTGLTSFGSYAIGEERCNNENDVWYGTTSTDWNTGSNWCRGIVPSSDINVTIPAEPTNQPIISAAAECKNISIETGASLTISGSNTLSIYGDWSLNGTFTSVTGTVSYAGSSAQYIFGETTFANLTINNPSGVSTENNITVNGILNLTSTNPSSTQGALSSGNSYTLTMGATATTIGVGDFTGTVSRTSFALNTSYTFGNQNTFINIHNATSLPTEIKAKISIGTSPSWKTGAIKRVYDFVQTGAVAAYSTLQLHYLDAELNGNSENNLVEWTYSETINPIGVNEWARSSFNITNNWISTNNINIANLSSSFGNFAYSLAISELGIFTWNGSASTNWTDGNNWTPYGVPASTNNVVIPDASTTTYSPELPAGAACNSIVLDSQAILNSVSGGTLTLSGIDQVWNKNQTAIFNAGNSTVILTGQSTIGIISLSGVNNFYNLTISSGSLLQPSVDSYTTISGTLTNNGTLFAASNVNSFEFNGSSNQTIPNGNGATTGYYNLTFSGVGNKILSPTIDIRGNFVNNSTIISTGNSIYFNGTTAQTIGGTATSTLLNNMYIQNTAGLSLVTDSLISVNNNLTIFAGSNLYIGPNKQLTANTITNNAGAGGLIIGASSSTSANGTLIFNNNAAASIQATVDMYSKASWNLTNPVGGKYKWQYFGIPVRSLVAYPTFSGAYVRYFNEPTSTWIQLNNASTLSSFTGYEVTQANGQFYTFQGVLENRDFTTQLAIDASGQYVFGNPFTAAIDIKEISFGAQMDSTVYLYNTGSYSDWYNTAQGTSFGNGPGQYFSVPQNQAGSGEIPGQIPSMQGFVVLNNLVAGDHHFSIPYSSVIKNKDRQRSRSVNKAASAEKIYTIIDVKGSRFSDRMWLFSEPTCTHTYNNGWDGYKFLGSTISPQLFASEPDGDYQVNSVDDFNNTELSFKTGEDTNYTLTFKNSNLSAKYSNVYLLDLVTNTTTDITQNGTEYSFTAVQSTTPVKRFRIVTNSGITTDIKNSSTSNLKVFNSRKTIIINNNTDLSGEMMLYDISGRYIKKYPFAANGLTTIPTNLTSGTYITKVSTNKEKFTDRIIIQ